MDLSTEKATVVPHAVQAATPPKRWWDVRRPATQQVTSLSLAA
jgi:hypothetical protein